jgi:hypothetical protein
VLPRLLHAVLSWLGARWSICLAQLVFAPQAAGAAAWPADGADEARAVEGCLALARMGFVPAGPLDAYWMLCAPEDIGDLPPPAALTLEAVAPRIAWPLSSDFCTSLLVLRAPGSQHSPLAVLPPADALLCLAVQQCFQLEELPGRGSRHAAPLRQAEATLALLSAAVGAGGSVDASCALHRALTEGSTRRPLEWHGEFWMAVNAEEPDQKAQQRSANLCAVLRQLLCCGGGAHHADAATGDTPLHVAAACAGVEAVSLLLEAGASRTTRNAFGKTAGDVAAARLSRMCAAAWNDSDAHEATLHAVADLMRLLLPTDVSGALVCGLLTPRMHYRLANAAAALSDEVDMHIGVYYRFGEVMTIDAAKAACFADVLPKDIIRSRFHASAAAGFLACIDAAGSVLASRQLPTLASLHASLDARAREHPPVKKDLLAFYKLGGSPLHGLAAVLQSARDTSETHGNGTFEFGDVGDEAEEVESHEARMRPLPYLTILEDDYKLLYAMLVGSQLRCQVHAHGLLI